MERPEDNSVCETISYAQLAQKIGNPAGSARSGDLRMAAIPFRLLFLAIA